MGRARDAIINDTFPKFLQSFFATYFNDTGYPRWCVDALRSVGVDILEGISDPKIIQDNGAKWDYAAS
jgi:queuine tRNA-ribosyltransferase